MHKSQDDDDGNQTLGVLFDSESLEKRFPELSRRAVSLFKYKTIKPLFFMRTEYPTNNSLLKVIPEIHLAKTNDVKYIETPNLGKHCLNEFFDMDIQRIGKVILNEQELTKEEVDLIQLVFIQEALNCFNGDNLLVTENRVLLSHAADFQRKFSTPLNIVTVEEASEFVDLLFKYNSLFYMSSYLTTSKYNWYWLSFRSKVSNYNIDVTRFQNLQVNRQTVGDLLQSSILDAFSQRFLFLLMSIDEIGFRYYSPVNNDTMEETTYHFNYFIVLITGIFDSLAIHAKNTYHIFENDPQIKASEISLRSKIGKKFLQAIEQKNPTLRKHIHDNADLINAPYFLRELIAHRESVHPKHFKINGTNVSFLFVTEEFADCLKQLGDNQESGGLSKFGIYSRTFLSPYDFCKAITVLLSRFCNQFLQLLDNNNSLIEEQKTDDSMKLFQEDNLGF